MTISYATALNCDFPQAGDGCWHSLWIQHEFMIWKADWPSALLTVLHAIHLQMLSSAFDPRVLVPGGPPGLPLHLRVSPEGQQRQLERKA